MNRFVSIFPSLVPCLLAVDCTCLTLTSHLQADYSGQFHLHSTSSFNDRPYYIRARDRSVTSSLRDCDLFLYVFAEVYQTDSVIDSPIPSPITSSSSDSPLCTSITPSLFHSMLKKPTSFTNPTPVVSLLPPGLPPHTIA